MSQCCRWLVLVAMPVLILTAGCNRSVATSREKAPQAVAATTVAPRSAAEVAMEACKADYELSPWDDLARSFIFHTASAKTKYSSKTVVLTGGLSSIAPDGSHANMEETPSPPFVIDCRFLESEWLEAAALMDNQVVTIKGVVSPDSSQSKVIVTDCVIVGEGRTSPMPKVVSPGAPSGPLSDNERTYDTNSNGRLDYDSTDYSDNPAAQDELDHYTEDFLRERGIDPNAPVRP